VRFDSYRVDNWRRRLFLKKGKKPFQSKNEFFIGEVSKAVNLSQKTIRDYENLGLFKPKRDARTNNRIYSEFEIEQIKHITHLIHNEGLTLLCIRRIIQMAPCWNIFGCEAKAQCPAFKNATMPCYEVRKKWGTLCAGSCDQCVIFINRSSKKIEKVLPRPTTEKSDANPR
jgi:MerR family transcriptional regulator, repressor of the yfmOP operon